MKYRVIVRSAKDEGQVFVPTCALVDEAGVTVAMGDLIADLNFDPRTASAMRVETGVRFVGEAVE